MSRGVITIRGSIAEYFGFSQNLKALWTFDGSYNDASGNGHHGTVVGGVFGDGIISGQSLICNGTDGYVNIPHHADFNFGTSVDYAIMGWIHRIAAQPGGNPVTIIDHRSAVTTGWTFWIANDTATLYTTIGVAGGIAGPALVGIFDRPIFVAMGNIRASGKIFFIVNDTLSYTTCASNTDVNTTNQLTIGSRSFTQPANTINSRIDELAIFSGIIPTASELVAYYQWSIAQWGYDIMLGM